MKIVVLAGGLSPERNAFCLRGSWWRRCCGAGGTKAALVDMYFGLEDDGKTLEDQLDALPMRKHVDRAALTQRP